MKRSTEALVMFEMVVVIAAIAIAGLHGTASAQTVSPVVKLSGDAKLPRSAARGDGAETPVFRVSAAFSTDPASADPFTIQRAVVLFPDRAGTNGRLFPSCGARQIERFRGNVARCPKGSKIGEGTLRARAIQLGVTASGRVTLFNSRRGRSVTFNFRSLHPALINESIEAPLTRLRGGRGERLTLVVPHSLQEILSGVYVGIQDFDVTISGAVRRRGVEHTFIRARACPKRPMRGVFDFKDWTTGQTARTTAATKVRCRVR